MCTTYVLASNNYHKEISACNLKSAMQQAQTESTRIDQCVDVYDTQSRWLGTATPAQVIHPLWVR